MSFVHVVESYGGTAREWNQNSFIRARHFDPGGVCAPLSLRWIRDRKLGVGFRLDMQTDDSASQVKRLLLNQKNSPLTFTATYLQLAGLRRHYTHNLKGDLSIGKLVAVATGGVGYYFIGISSKGVVRDEDASAHALAIDMFATKFANINKEGKYAFFDPNFGQAEFSDVQALKSCFITHFRLEYPTLHGHASIERYLGR